MVRGGVDSDWTAPVGLGRLLACLLPWLPAPPRPWDVGVDIAGFIWRGPWLIVSY